MHVHSGLTAQSQGYQLTSQGKLPAPLETFPALNDRCRHRKMGFVSQCDRPVKAYFQSVCDSMVVFQVCGIHRRLLTKYAERGSFIEIEAT